MTTIIALFILALAAAIVIPTLPGSRRLRLVLAVVAIPAVILANHLVEVRASYIGADQIDIFIQHSQQLLKQGKTQILIDAYQDYQEQHGPTVPKAAGPAYRAWLLDNLVRQHELDQKHEGK